MDQEFRQAVLQASTRPDVRSAVGEVYDALGQAIEQRKPICSASGRCCRFEEYGHRLYVTTLEMAKFVFDLSVVRDQLQVVDGPCVPEAPGKVAGLSLPVFTTHNRQPTTHPRDCPFQLDRLCGVHAIRPFGCRVFFCDETATDWQHDMYERLHGQLRRRHEELGVPYFYVEWRFAVRTLGLG